VAPAGKNFPLHAVELSDGPIDPEEARVGDPMIRTNDDATAAAKAILPTRPGSRRVVRFLVDATGIPSRSLRDCSVSTRGLERQTER
jgi:hypothetical protein